MDHQNHGDVLESAEIDEPADKTACPQCRTVVRLVRTIVDSATGRSVRMFECTDCGMRTGND